MAISIENTKRRIVPRWPNFRHALKSGELDPPEFLIVGILPPDDYLLRKKKEWEEYRTILFATDLIGAAYVMGQDELAHEAAQFVIDSRQDVSSVAISVAKNILNIPEIGGEDESLDYSAGGSHIYGDIKKLKAKRIDQPRNAFVWSDLARLYTILGLQEQASKAMQIALSLAPQNRYILRSAARLKLHLNEPDIAHNLLRKASNLEYDPWLMAAEIAVSSVLGKTSRYLKAGLDMVRDESIDPFHLCELSSALASVELWNGKNKNAKRLFNRSLYKPNENTLAQAAWATTYIPIDSLSKDSMSRATAFEAIALISYFEGKWKDSLEASLSWRNEELFSRRPPIQISFLMSEIFENYSGAIKLIGEALRIIPKDPTLLNNLAFALANQGLLADALKTLKCIDLSKSQITTKICITATAGLIEYRAGRPDRGRELYSKAIQDASKASLLSLKCRAMIYLAREEMLTYGLSSDNYRQSAVKEGRKLNDPGLDLLIQRLEHFDFKKRLP